MFMSCLELYNDPEAPSNTGFLRLLLFAIVLTSLPRSLFALLRYLPVAWCLEWLPSNRTPRLLPILIHPFQTPPAPLRARGERPHGDHVLAAPREGLQGQRQGALRQGNPSNVSQSLIGPNSSE